MNSICCFFTMYKVALVFETYHNLSFSFKIYNVTSIFSLFICNIWWLTQLSAFFLFWYFFLHSYFLTILLMCLSLLHLSIFFCKPTLIISCTSLNKYVTWVSLTCLKIKFMFSILFNIMKSYLLIEVGYLILTYGQINFH